MIPPSEIIPRYFQLGRAATTVRSITRRKSGKAYLGAMEPDRPGHGPAGRVLGRLREIARTQPSWLLILRLSLPIILVLGVAYIAGRATSRQPPPRSPNGTETIHGA